MRPPLHSAPVSLLLIAALSVQVASAATLEEIERGLAEQAAVSSEEASGYKVVKSELAGGYLVNQPQTNKTVGILRVCKGRIYSHSTAAMGGAVGFVKRVEQFNKQFGTPEVSASSAMLDPGELNTIEASWRRGRHVVTLTFTPASQGIGETQWVQYAVPTVCQ